MGYENKITIYISEECKKLIRRCAEENSMPMATYARKEIMDPWYIAKAAQCSKLTVYFKGDIIRIQQDDDNRNSQSDSD